NRSRADHLRSPASLHPLDAEGISMTTKRILALSDPHRALPLRRLGRRLSRAACVALLAPAIPGAVHAAPATGPERPLPPPARFVLYLQGRRIGSSTDSFTRTTFEGKPAILQESSMVMKLNAGGEVEQTRKTQSYASLEKQLLFVRSERTEGHVS